VASIGYWPASTAVLNAARTKHPGGVQTRPRSSTHDASPVLRQHPRRATKARRRPPRAPSRRRWGGLWKPHVRMSCRVCRPNCSRPQPCGAHLPRGKLRLRLAQPGRPPLEAGRQGIVASAVGTTGHQVARHSRRSPSPLQSRGTARDTSPGSLGRGRRGKIGGTLPYVARGTAGGRSACAEIALRLAARTFASHKAPVHETTPTHFPVTPLPFHLLRRFFLESAEKRADGRRWNGRARPNGATNSEFETLQPSPSGDPQMAGSGLRDNLGSGRQRSRTTRNASIAPSAPRLGYSPSLVAKRASEARCARASCGGGLIATRGPPHVSLCEAFFRIHIPACNPRFSPRSSTQLVPHDDSSIPLHPSSTHNSRALLEDGAGRIALSGRPLRPTLHPSIAGPRPAAAVPSSCPRPRRGFIAH